MKRFIQSGFLGRALAAMVLIGLLQRGAGADLKIKIIDKEPPKELSEPIRKLIAGKALQLLDGDSPVYEFWLVSELPLQTKPASTAKALDAIKQTTLLGAVSIAKSQRDYRDDELAAGIYTMRFGLQPTDGNHLGTSEFPYFALLIPAKLDPTVDGISTYKALTKASSKETTTENPVILSLRPAAAEGGEPKLNEPAPEHKSVRVKVPAKAGEEKTSAIFELVFEGKGKK